MIYLWKVFSSSDTAWDDHCAQQALLTKGTCPSLGSDGTYRARVYPGGSVLCSTIKAAVTGWPHPELRLTSALGAPPNVNITTRPFSRMGAFQTLPAEHREPRSPSTKPAAGPRGQEQHIASGRSDCASAVGSHLAATSPRVALN